MGDLIEGLEAVGLSPGHPTAVIYIGWFREEETKRPTRAVSFHADRAAAPAWTDVNVNQAGLMPVAQTVRYHQSMKGCRAKRETRYRGACDYTQILRASIKYLGESQSPERSYSIIISGCLYI